MFLNRNTRINNNNIIISGHPQQYPEYTNLDKMNIYNNNINNPNNINIINSNNNINKNLKNTNVKKGIKLNLNKTNNINNNIKGNINNNINLINNNNMNNININQNNQRNNNNLNNRNNISNNNNSNNQNNMIIKALSLIRNEFMKKDQKIQLLESQVEELEKKISELENNNINNQNQNEVLNNNYMNNQNQIPLKDRQNKIGKNFTFSEKYSDDINNMKIPQEPNIYNIPNKNIGMNNIGINYGNKSDNQFKINNKERERENSVKTRTSENLVGNNKAEVKNYLKEVKNTLDSISFKKFIHCIKLLTSKGKNDDNNKSSNIDRDSVVESVRLLFGEKYQNLFDKFREIIGYNN